MFAKVQLIYNTDLKVNTQRAFFFPGIQIKNGRKFSEHFFEVKTFSSGLKYGFLRGWTMRTNNKKKIQQDHVTVGPHIKKVKFAPVP